MKIIAMSDFHGDYSLAEKILKKANNPDMIVLTGDITNFGPQPDKRALKLLDIINTIYPNNTILAIPGNCDQRSILNTLDESRAINLHKKMYKKDDIVFLGLGGSNPTPFNTPFELTEEEISNFLKELLDKASGFKGKKTVLVTHAPPKNTLDKVSKVRVGSEALTEAIGSVDLILCGHIHECQGVKEISGTKIVNVGQASRGQGALIEINNEIKVYLLN